MATVYLAGDLRHERSVALKVLRPELAAALGSERFLREIQIAARLTHPNILSLHDSGDADGLLYYVMPYVEGESLRSRLAREKQLRLAEALQIAREVADALSYAHVHDVVHRDVKPENILLGAGHAVVSDFGIARAIRAAAGDKLTSTGITVGTPGYMSPEQAAGNERLDGRSDIYSLGCVLYEMLSGAHPFASSNTAQAVLAAHLAETPAPLATRRPGLPPALASLVDRCLAKDPSQRPRDAAVLAQLTLPAGSPVRRPLLRPVYLVPAALALLLLAGGGARLYMRSERRHWAREEAIPGITKLSAADQPLAAFLVFRKAQQYLPADSQLARFAAANTQLVSVHSSPPGAAVDIQDYLSMDTAWYHLGSTPLTNVQLPYGYFRWRLSKPGIGAYVAAPIPEKEMTFRLDSAGSAPPGMVWVGGGTFLEYVDFLGVIGPYNLPPYYIDRFEVTNREYQQFVDSGGYRRRAYWTHPFAQRGGALTWGEAMAQFRDRTGRAGPATWEGGHYPEGQGDYPVSGVSWYEASAYAAFAGKTLPRLAQWYRAAPPGLVRYVVQVSNIGRASVAAVGSFKGVGPYGTYDMAGNVREWIVNAAAANRHLTLGGAWSSQPYLYGVPEAPSSFDRSSTNGFRCVRDIAPVPPEVSRPVKTLERDFTKARPASDEVFRAYQVMYAYDKTPLNAVVEAVVADTRDWREEKITFDGAYGNERMAAYLFLPKKVRAPYQTVVYFPSDAVRFLSNSETLIELPFFDYVVQGGRAVLYPVYQGTYERRVKTVFPGASQEMALTIQSFKDLGRSLDYLQTRPDIASEKLAYLGVSLGAAEGVIYTTLLQERLRAVLLVDGGFFLGRPRAGRDQVDFAPRLKKPVLMVNGRYDYIFSLEKAQLPLFRMLGTPDADKRHVVLPVAHDVLANRTDLVKEVLGWLDKYLGRVE